MLHPSVATRIIQDGAEKIAKLFPAGRDMLQILVFLSKTDVVLQSSWLADVYIYILLHLLVRSIKKLYCAYRKLSDDMFLHT